MRNAAVWILAGSVLIAGCGKHEPTQAPAPAKAPATPSLLQERPHPKAGLWRTSISTNAGPGITMSGEMCLDEATENSAFTSGARGAKDCDAPQFAPTPGGLAFTATCHAGGRTIITKGVATGDFQSSYALDLATRIDPAPAGVPAEMHARMQATWVGPCRPGQKPGQASMKFGGFGHG
jgi:hypothetical protein